MNRREHYSTVTEHFGKGFLNDIMVVVSRTIWFLKFHQNTVMFEHKTSKTTLVPYELQ